MSGALGQASGREAFSEAVRPRVSADRAGKGKRGGEKKGASPLVIRLTAEERARLEEMAMGMTLSAYVRACLFGQEAKRRKRRPKDVVADKRPAAEALALLGQSRIASNLNQLAYHANIGALEIGPKEAAQVQEAYDHVVAIRSLLVAALGRPG